MIQSSKHHVFIMLKASFFSIHDYWQMTNLSGESRGSFLILIFHSHHNRQAVIVVLISKGQEDGFHLVGRAAAQMFALKTNETI